MPELIYCRFFDDQYNKSVIIEMKLRKVGGSLMAVLPKEAVAELDVEAGDKLFLNKTPDGSFRMTAGNPEFDRQMAIARKGMRRYRNALQVLAQ